MSADWPVMTRPALAEGVEGFLDLADAQSVEGVAFPGVSLAAVDGEFDGRQARLQSAEHPARSDLGQLVVVADEDHLGGRPPGELEEVGELAGPDHRRLVDDEHRPRR